MHPAPRPCQATAEISIAEIRESCELKPKELLQQRADVLGSNRPIQQDLAKWVALRKEGKDRRKKSWLCIWRKQILGNAWLDPAFLREIAIEKLLKEYLCGHLRRGGRE